MRTISIVRLDKQRPALILTREPKRHLLTWVTIAPITTTIRGLASEVPAGPRNGLDHACVISCDNIMTVRAQRPSRSGLEIDGEQAIVDAAVDAVVVVVVDADVVADMEIRGAQRARRKSCRRVQRLP